MKVLGVKVRVLGVGFDPVSPEDAFSLALRWLGEGGGLHLVVTANPETVMKAQRLPDLARAIERADLVVADGVGVVWASRRLGRPLPGRVAGIELAERLLEHCAGTGQPVFLLGGRPASPGQPALAGRLASAGRRAAAGRPAVAEAAAGALARRWPGLRVCGTWHGYFTREDEPAVLQALSAARPVLLLCGMGSPRQELWLARHAAFLQECGVRVAIGVGGALDVWSGDVGRAPPLLRWAGLEWLWRLGQNPRRLGRQLQLVTFVLEVLRHGDN
ncbi:MAG: WecB/TagA/CpsF family glycosyltransferase [Bacillota bacterium]